MRNGKFGNLVAEPAMDGGNKRVGWLSSELALRSVSALVLALVTLILTWAGVASFAILVAAVALVVLWEWGHIVRSAGFDRVYSASSAIIIIVVLLVAAGKPLLAVAALTAGAVAIFAANRHDKASDAALGVLYAGLAAIALVWIRSAPLLGFSAIVFLMLIVWGADSGAYACGRMIGGPKLWPAISPKKTWAGLAGALLTGCGVAVVYTLAVTGGRPLAAAVTGTTLALVSQGGDLLESAIKRRHGVKDASGLIPGHGGFMDRVDGLIFAAVAGALYAAVVDVADPASVLLAVQK